MTSKCFFLTNWIVLISDEGILRLVDPSVYSHTDRMSMDDSKPSGCPLHRNQGLLLSLDDLTSNLAQRFDCPAHINSPVCFASGKVKNLFKVIHFIDGQFCLPHFF